MPGRVRFCGISRLSCRDLLFSYEFWYECELFRIWLTGENFVIIINKVYIAKKERFLTYRKRHTGAYDEKTLEERPGIGLEFFDGV